MAPLYAEVTAMQPGSPTDSRSDALAAVDGGAAGTIPRATRTAAAGANMAEVTVEPCALKHSYEEDLSRLPGPMPMTELETLSRGTNTPFQVLVPLALSLRRRQM